MRIYFTAILFCLLSLATGCTSLVGATQPETPDLTPVLNDLQVEKNRLELELNNTQEYLSEIESKLEATEAILEATRLSQYKQHDPTYDEVLAFLEDDPTNHLEYIDNEQVCSHFAAAVNNAAEEQGIRCALVIVRFAVRNHAIIGFDTLDQGMVFFEPQSDEAVYPVIGKEYWRCIEPRPGFYYEKPDYDDIITELVIVW